MTPHDLQTAWPDGIPQSGVIQLKLAPWAEESAEFREILAENIQILAESLTKGLSHFAPDYEMHLTPQPVANGVWPIRFSPSLSATDSIAYCLNGFSSLLKGIEEPWFTDLQIQPEGGALQPHRMIVPRHGTITPVSREHVPLSQEDLVFLQHSSIFAVLPLAETFDQAAMEDALFAVGDLVDVGAFDLPSLEIEYDTTTPFIGQDPDGNQWELGLYGFRGTGDLASVLLAAIEQTLGHKLNTPQVIVEVSASD